MTIIEGQTKSPSGSKEQFTHIGNWNTPYGLIYGEFDHKDDPGVEFFGQFKEMVREISTPKKVAEADCYVEYMEMILKITHRVNEAGTNMNDDYVFVDGKEVLGELQKLVETGRLKPFWIEIQGSWMNIMYSKGKKNFMTLIVALNKKKAKELWGGF